MRRYEVRHSTRYTYEKEVTESYGRAYLTPRHDAGQRLLEHSVQVSPGAALSSSEFDYYGNATTYTEVLSGHTELRVSAQSLVQVQREVPDLAALPQTVAEAAEQPDRGLDSWESLWAKDFLLPSRHVPGDAAVAAYGAGPLSPERAVGAAVLTLMHQIHTDLRYAPGVTSVSTTPGEVLHQRAGVCQDFAHLMLTCLRAAGLPARYVSGYLETLPPPGQPKRVGADASHAWVSVLLPGVGWVDLDPTNDQVVDEGYVVLAWGRDYADVTPLRGVVYSDGATLELDVAVDIVRQQDEPTD